MALRSAGCVAVGLSCLAHPDSQRTIDRSFESSVRTYGARRVWHDVLADGFSCGLHRIERLMRENALRARPRRRVLPKNTGERAAVSQNLRVLVDDGRHPGVAKPERHPAISHHFCGSTKSLCAGNCVVLKFETFGIDDSVAIHDVKKVSGHTCYSPWRERDMSLCLSMPVTSLTI